MNQYSGTKQKSPRRPRTLNGQFEPDNTEEIKRLRSIRLTDTAWEELAEIAALNHITRTEVIEIFARGTTPDPMWSDLRSKYCNAIATALGNRCVDCHQPIMSLKFKFCPYCGVSYKQAVVNA